MYPFDSVISEHWWALALYILQWLLSPNKFFFRVIPMNKLLPDSHSGYSTVAYNLLNMQFPTPHARNLAPRQVSVLEKECDT